MRNVLTKEREEEMPLDVSNAIACNAIPDSWQFVRCPNNFRFSALAVAVPLALDDLDTCQFREGEIIVTYIGRGWPDVQLGAKMWAGWQKHFAMSEFGTNSGAKFAYLHVWSQWV